MGKRNQLKKESHEYNPTWFKCDFGLLADFAALSLTTQQKKIFACIVEQVNAYHPANRQNLTAVAISNRKFMEVAETKSKSYITKTIKSLIAAKLIEVESGNGGKNPSKYKIIDNRFLPLHLRKNRGKTL